MKSKTVEVPISELVAIRNDLAIIKHALLGEDDEGELTDWAKEELAKARAEPEENYVSLEDLEAEILGK